MKTINKGNVDHKVHLSFKDILLQPFDKNWVNIISRSIPDISSEVCPGKHIDIPLVSSPMDSVTGPEMAVAVNNCGGLGINTRYINDNNETSKLVEAVKYIKKNSRKGYVSCAVGVKNNVHDLVRQLCDNGLDIICLDIANGNHILMQKAIKDILPLKDFYKISIIAGNVATGLAAKRLSDEGVDAIKIGIGPGAVCTTRRVVGMGVPQFTAILDCAEALAYTNTKIIADGGIRQSGDVVKALWAGADTIMSGYVFSGHQECPEFAGKKMYRGMSSRTVSGRDDIAAEGVCIEIQEKGSISNTISQYAAAIKSACSMANANNLDELRKNVKAVRVSTLTTEESDPVTM